MHTSETMTAKRAAMRETLGAAMQATYKLQTLQGTLIAFSAMPDQDGLALDALRDAIDAATTVVIKATELLQTMVNDVAVREADKALATLDPPDGTPLS